MPLSKTGINRFIYMYLYHFLENQMSDYIYCSFCGARNHSSNKFCENCGDNMLKATSSTQKESVTPPSQESRNVTYQQVRGPSTYKPTNPPMSGSYDALPRTRPYNQNQNRSGFPKGLKIFLLLFFFGIPVILVLVGLFTSWFWWF